MATISTADFKTGIGIKIDGKAYILLEFQHVKPGKGAAFVRTKVRDIMTNRVNDLTFRAGEKFESVHMATKEMQYLYLDGENFVFMDTNTYEQVEVSSAVIGDDAKWIKENDICLLQYADADLVGVTPPMFIEVEVTMTEPGFKGDTAKGGNKPATVETGAEVQVPLFIETGDIIRIDTRDGRYVTRV